MKNIEVRGCDRDDVQLLAALGRKTFKATYADSSDPAEMQAHIDEVFGEDAIAQEISRSTVRYFMAEKRDSCAGLIKLRYGQKRALLPVDRACEIQQLYVSPDFQRRGVGRALMDAAVSHAQKAGVQGMFLSVWSKADWATAFYSDYGYRSLGEVPFMIGATEYTDWLMWLPIED
jgi:ribosomal protein S18 acetylase RimI-like enzyme